MLFRCPGGKEAEIARTEQRPFSAGAGVRPRADGNLWLTRAAATGCPIAAVFTRSANSAKKQPGNSHRGGSAQQVDQVIIEPSTTFKDGAKQAIYLDTEKTGAGDEGRIVKRRHLCPQRRRGDGHYAQQGGQYSARADAAVSSRRDRL